MEDRRIVLTNNLNLFDNQSQTQRYQTYAESNTFYRSLRYVFNGFNNDPLNFDRRLYQNQTQIPNNLKRNTWERRMILKRLRDNNVYSIIELVESRCFDIKTILVHIPIEGVRLLLTVDKIKDYINLNSFQTYILFMAEIRSLKISLQVTTIPSVLCFELIHSNQVYPIPAIDTQNNLHVETSLWNDYKSFTLTPIFNPIKQIIFMSTKFVFEYNGNAHLAEITILNYSGNIMLDTLVCPRVHIVNFATPLTGLTPNHLINQMDQGQAYKIINNILKGCIVIGLEVSKQITRMKLEPKNIRGIRDFSHIKTQEVDNFKNQWWENTLDEARSLYDLYVPLKDKWRDDYTSWETDFEKVPWDIVNQYSIDYIPIIFRRNEIQVNSSHIVSTPQLTITIHTDPKIRDEEDSEDEIWLDPMTEEMLEEL